jgi:hypothetical protein
MVLSLASHSSRNTTFLLYETTQPRLSSGTTPGSLKYDILKSQVRPGTSSDIIKLSQRTIKYHQQALTSLMGRVPQTIPCRGQLPNSEYAERWNIQTCVVDQKKICQREGNLTRMTICVTGGEALSVRKHRDVYIPS